MTESWGSVFAELIPLALVVALSPLSIIPAVLVLHSPRPRPAGLSPSRRMVSRPGRADGDLRRRLRPVRPARRATDVGVVVAHRCGRRADRLRCVPLSHPGTVRAQPQVDGQPEQAHAGPGGCRRPGAHRGEPQGAVHLRGSRFGDRQRRPRSAGRLGGKGCTSWRSRGRRWPCRSSRTRCPASDWTPHWPG